MEEEKKFTTKETKELQHRVAQEALQKADAQELFVLYEKLVKERHSLELCIDALSMHYSGKSDTPRLAPQNPGAVDAMKEVALAAIDLAKSIATKD